jgi:SWI/SNF-related matrix-associated actin-dependent regulator of chromatin subfamily A3
MFRNGERINKVPGLLGILSTPDWCFYSGKQLKDIQVRIDRALTNPILILDEIHGGDGTLFSSLDLRIGEERSDIIVCGYPIATLHQKTHLALKCLAPQPSYKGMVPRQEFQQRLAAAEVSAGVSLANLSISISVILSGPRLMADSLAKGLSKYRLFLQHPNPKPPGLEYVNPQYLTMVGSYLPNGAVLAPIPMDAFDLDASRRNDVEQDLEDEVDLRAVMDNLPQHAYLRDADIDGRVNATLLKFVQFDTSGRSRHTRH